MNKNICEVIEGVVELKKDNPTSNETSVEKEPCKDKNRQGIIDEPVKHPDHIDVLVTDIIENSDSDDSIASADESVPEVPTNQDSLN